MVSQEKERRDYPAYDLGHVRRLAQSEHVNYRSRTVERDVVNLGYTLGEVCQCIACLEEKHFQHSERPVHQKRWQDVYHCRWRVPSAGGPDDLYVKLMLTKSTITVELCSFHRHR